MLSIDEAADLLAQTGYRRATSRLIVVDKSSISSALIDYHFMMKVKAAMDQYKDGPNELSVLSMIQKNPAIWKPMFVSMNLCLHQVINYAHLETFLVGYLSFLSPAEQIA